MGPELQDTKCALQESSVTRQLMVPNENDATLGGWQKFRGLFYMVVCVVVQAESVPVVVS
jgi:hypothetical protein